MRPNEALSDNVRFGDVRSLLTSIPRPCRVVTDNRVAACYREVLGEMEHVFEVPAGESSKSFAQYSSVVDWLVTSGARRTTPVVAFGGGVVGDLAGFVAATYLRGVPLYQVPTSLMAQIDSSIGGKVGIDTPQGKNLLGAFWPAAEVLIDPTLLQTLEPRQFRNGLAEAVKYAFIADPDLLDLLHNDRLLHSEVVDELVRRCVRQKVAIVKQDPHERTGMRATLNFGHTIGHAIEAEAGFGPILHGEAVSIGMFMETKLGVQLGLTTPDVEILLLEVLTRLGLPTQIPPGMNAELLLPWMRRDKKVEGAGLAVSIVTRVGECKLVRGVEESAICALFEKV